MLELSAEKKRVLEATGHLLVLGGPGSGKTTIALLKADREIQAKTLRKHQTVLFLSFARPTVARVQQLATEILTREANRLIEINTYHGFTWGLLRSHGYLLNGRKSPRLLPPPEASARFAEIDGVNARRAEMRRLFDSEGLLHFDLFAEYAADLLHRSARLRRIVSAAFPIIVLDEFQDTNAAEWRLIQALGSDSHLLALADADQRIYEFRGADPKRIGEFVASFAPTEFDFGVENNRSNGTDIVTFGNDLLAGRNQGKSYKDVACLDYRVLKGDANHLDLKVHVFKAMTRLAEAQIPDWSLAILVPTNQLMMDVSDYLSSIQPLKGGRVLPAIRHDVAFDTAGPALAASVIATALEGGAEPAEIAKRLLGALRDHIRGRKGNSVASNQQLELAGFVEKHLLTGLVRGSARKALVDGCSIIAAAITQNKFKGDPGEDWSAIRKLFHDSASEPLRAVANDARYLRLLHRGSSLRSRLSELWRSSGSYSGAAAAVSDALLQEHFAVGTKEWTGVHVMTIHKSKGKEFDEVIVYEGKYQHRIVASGASAERTAEARRNLRVAVSRARRRVTLLTPKNDRCPLL